MFGKAKKSNAAPKIALAGPSGSGKTYSALRLARGYVGPEGRVAVVDTENGSASLYADKFDFDVAEVAPREFEVGGLKARQFWHADFLDAINAALDERYDLLIVDSASHIWEGVLDYKSRVDAGGGNSYANWAKAGAQYKTVIDLILQAPIPVVCCFRSKQAYVLEEDERGKKVPVKKGLAPIARDGVEYEFASFFEIDRAHVATATKDRSGLFVDESTITEATGDRLRRWLRGELASANVASPAESASFARAVRAVDVGDDYDDAESPERVAPPPTTAERTPGNGLESLDAITSADFYEYASRFGWTRGELVQASVRKFGVAPEDLPQEDLRDIYYNLKPKGRR